MASRTHNLKTRPGREGKASATDADKREQRCRAAGELAIRDFTIRSATYSREHSASIDQPPVLGNP